MCKLPTETKARLGNALIYIAKHAAHPSKTSALIILYIMEETMVQRYGVPFLGLPFEVWSMGPVQKDVYADISDGGPILQQYINVVPGIKGNGVNIVAKRPFDEDDFSDLELSMMDNVLQTFGNLSAEKLVAYLHRPDSLWYRLASSNGMLDAFNNGMSSASDIRMDLGDLLPDSKKVAYEESLMIHNTANEMRTAENV